MRRLLLSFVVVFSFVAVPLSAGFADEPALPAGLFGADDGVSAGGGAAVGDAGETGTEEAAKDVQSVSGGDPVLPSGLGGDEEFMSDGDVEHDGVSGWKDRMQMFFTGFVEGRVGVRVKDDSLQKKNSVGEVRFHLEGEKEFGAVTGGATADFVYNPVLGEHDVELETGDGWFDLREAYLVGQPADFVDFKVGRQILTWGTGDLVFINDLFPKDWNSFFVGRDVEYLKAPSDALKTSFFTDLGNMDVVYTPRFDSDRFMDGRVISYYDGNSGHKAGRESQIYVDKPDEWFSDDEWSVRAYRGFGAVEGALYFYDGFWKSPAGQNPASGLKTFPRLSVYGASVRAPFMSGIANVEAGYYDSRDNRDGSDMNVPTGEVRFLAGYEQELATDFTGAFQYYLERKTDYDAYRRSLPVGAKKKDKNRHVATVRLTKFAMNQNLELSLFNFYSPSDRDGYARFNAKYKINDDWRVEGGANLFYGKDEHTFFAQYDDNSNVYVALRYGF